MTSHDLEKLLSYRNEGMPDKERLVKNDDTAELFDLIKLLNSVGDEKRFSPHRFWQIPKGY